MKIEDNIVYMTSGDKPEECFELLSKGLARQVYIEAANRPSQEVIDQAVAIDRLSTAKLAFGAGRVIIGPFPAPGGEFLEKLPPQIGTTFLEFPDFVEEQRSENEFSRRELARQDAADRARNERT